MILDLVTIEYVRLLAERATNPALGIEPRGGVYCPECGQEDDGSQTFTDAHGILVLPEGEARWGRRIVVVGCEGYHTFDSATGLERDN